MVVVVCRKPIVAPLPDIGGAIHDLIRRRTFRITPDGRCPLSAILHLVSSNSFPQGQKCPSQPRACFLPLRFRWQADFNACFPAEPLTVGEGILARYAYNGVVKSLRKRCFSQFIPDRFAESIQFARSVR